MFFIQILKKKVSDKVQYILAHALINNIKTSVILFYYFISYNCDLIIRSEGGVIFILWHVIQ